MNFSKAPIGQGALIFTKMKEKEIKILAIESSCDETAAAVIGEREGRPVILSNIISSQVDLHAKTNGVVPEVASRAHLEAIVPVVAQALTEDANFQLPTASIDQQANIEEAIGVLDGITHIAVTSGPGLVGSLLVGFNAAKTIAYAKNLPIVPINHIEGHIYSAFTTEPLNTKYQIPNTGKPFPILALTVSGGHTSITLMRDHGVYEQIGQTLDDAVGEAYDKVAKLLDLGYPGGPILSKSACEYRENYGHISEEKQNPIKFPRPIINDGTFNFSFSGLKTAVLVEIKRIIAGKNFNTPSEIEDLTKKQIAAAFEEAVADVLATKIGRAIEKYSPRTLVFAGGVSANGYLRERIGAKAKEVDPDISYFVPAKGLHGDNAAMIGIAAYYHIKRGDISTWDEVKIDSNSEL